MVSAASRYLTALRKYVRADAWQTLPSYGYAVDATHSFESSWTSVEDLDEAARCIGDAINQALGIAQKTRAGAITILDGTEPNSVFIYAKI